MPIRAADGRVLGTFANYYREPRKPSERDLEVIGMVSRTAAIAIERSQNEKARDRAVIEAKLRDYFEAAPGPGAVAQCWSAHR